MFFRLAFGDHTGIVCIAFLTPGKRGMTENFYRYPEEVDQMLIDIERVHTTTNVYFCPQLLVDKKGGRRKENILSTPTAWADLDTCGPEKLPVEPSVLVESSPNRFQALWSFERETDIHEAEGLSKRIAYHHAPDGADRSGWDLTQLLRVPYTYNLKYAAGVSPLVKLIGGTGSKYRLKDFEMYPVVKGTEFLDIPFPDEWPNLSADDIFEKYQRKFNPKVFALYQIEPEGDWSKDLWQLQMLLFEAGLTREEVFIVAKASACNKYARDGRPDQFLWKDVCRAFQKNEENLNIVIPESVQQIDIITPEEKTYVEAHPGFVERYIEWAKSLGDAAHQYHQAGAFTVLSSLLAGAVRLPTSYGTIVPNLWFMILADTTLTRKTTAMDIAMDLLEEVDSSAVLATDGSIEGLLTSLSTRPGRPSVFLRDEFSGLLEALTKKDYMAGMAEMLTKLYDGKTQKRVLRKEIIEVRDPRLIFFAGGIKNRVTQLLSFDHVSSGFMPRFVFITAESDVSRVRPLGPPTEANLGNRDAILDELRDIQAHYQTTHDLKIEGGKVAAQIPRLWSASMSPAAWQRYNRLEAEMMEAALKTEHPDLMTPTYDRLCKSIIKAALLVAASRQRDQVITIEEEDLVHAIYYGQSWRAHVHEVINNVGKGTAEREYEKILHAVVRKPGISRSMLMQYYHLNAREADSIFQTLEQRGQVTRQKAGRTETLWPVGKASDKSEDHTAGKSSRGRVTIHG